MSEWFQIEPACRRMLAAAALTGLDAWLAYGRADAARVVSRHVDRVTVSLELADPACDGAPAALFAKIHFSTPIKQTLAYLLGGQRPISRPANEWNWLHRLGRLGFDAMEPVAVGERRRLGLPGAAVLVVRAVPAAKSLHQLLLEDPAAREDPALWSAIGRLVGRLRRHDLLWPDVGAKHLFPRQDGGEWRIFMIDVERMSAGPIRPPPLAPVRRLLEALPISPSPDVIAAMVRGIGAECDEPAAQSLDADRLAQTVQDTAGRRPRLPDPHSYWHTSAPETVQAGPVVFNAAYRGALAAAGLGDLEAIFNYAGGESLSKPGLPGHRRRDRVVLAGSSKALYLKRYQPPRRQRLLRAIRPGTRASEAADEWHALWRLAESGVAVPEPILFAQSSGRGAAARSCIALAELPNARSLERWLPEHGPTLAADRRRVLFERLADFVSYFHSLGTVHRDLYLSHVFIRTDCAEPAFCLIDLARVFRPTRWRRDRWIVKDLAQLRYSLGGMIQPPEWEALLRRYLGLPAGEPDARFRRLAGRIERKVRSIAHHAGRRSAEGAPVGRVPD